MGMFFRDSAAVDALEASMDAEIKRDPVLRAAWKRQEKSGGSKHAVMLPPWTKVVFSSDCDEDGNCPTGRTDYADCACPADRTNEARFLGSGDGGLALGSTGRRGWPGRGRVGSGFGVAGYRMLV